MDNVDEIARLIATREKARLQKDWTLADTIRTQLSTMGITLYDKAQTWKSNDGRNGRIPTFNDIDGGNLETVVATMAAEMAAEQPAGVGAMGTTMGSMSGMSADVMNALNATGAMAATGASDTIEEVARLIATREQARLQ